MRLPKKFYLGAIPVEVQVDNTYGAQHNAGGMSIYGEQKIIIDAQIVPEESVAQTFYHELTHWILYIMGKHTLRNDEEFVDVFAHFLYQALESFEYEEEGKGVPRKTEAKKAPLRDKNRKQPEGTLL